MKKMLFVLLLVVSLGMLAAVESNPSAVVGYVKYTCYDGLNLVALPMNSGYAMCSDFANANPSAGITEMNAWNSETQTWETAVDWGYWEGDFPVAPGMVLMINCSASSIFSLGSLPAVNAPLTVNPDYNLMMVPLNRADIGWTSQFATAVGDGFLTEMNAWNGDTQSWVTAVDWGYWEGDFEISIGTPLMVFSVVDNRSGNSANPNDSNSKIRNSKK